MFCLPLLQKLSKDWQLLWLWGAFETPPRTLVEQHHWSQRGRNLCESKISSLGQTGFVDCVWIISFCWHIYMLPSLS